MVCASSSMQSIGKDRSLKYNMESAVIQLLTGCFGYQASQGQLPIGDKTHTGS